MTKSLHGATLKSEGIRLLATTLPCAAAGFQDLCDPNGCTITSSDAGDVDSSYFTGVQGGGVTLAPPADAGACTGLGCQVPAACPDQGYAITDWFQVDMMAAQTFGEVKLDATNSANDCPRGYQLFVSNDGVNWGIPVAVGLAPIDPNTGACLSPITTITFPPQTAQFIRIVQTGSTIGDNPPWWWSIDELNVYSAGPTPMPLNRTTWQASAARSNACAPGNCDPPGNALDGNLNTRWTTGYNPSDQHPGSTTLTGVVYDPAGVNPVYNALVYVPRFPTLPGISSGASCDTCPDPAAVDAIALGRTGPDGVFILTNVPSTDVAPNAPIPLVVRAGKWRREVFLSAVPQCAITAVPAVSSRLPQSSLDYPAGGSANVPKMAIATGAEDPFECLFLKMGVQSSEFQLPGGSRRIDYYRADGVDFTTPAPAESTLVGSAASLQPYDAVILPSEGTEDDSTNQYADNVAAYANNGGRLLTTHFSYTWLATPKMGAAQATNPVTNNANTFYPVANWDFGGKQPAPWPSVTALVDGTLAGGQYFAGGSALSSWLVDVGASTTPGQVAINPAYDDVASVSAQATEWMHDLTTAAHEPLLFSFDTPVGATGGACGRVVHSEFHVPTGGASAGATFPMSCGSPPAAMTPKEKALEFMVLGLTDCLAPQGPVPPPPAVRRPFTSATFVETFSMPTCTTAGQTSCCPSGTHVVWRELDWQASVPSTSSIGFSLQTADPALDGGPPDWISAMTVPLATATSSTQLPLFDLALIDTGTTGVFNLATPPLSSRTELRLTVTLQPTSDGTQSPTLLAWLVKADCMPSE